MSHFEGLSNSRIDQYRWVQNPQGRSGLVPQKRPQRKGKRIVCAWHVEAQRTHTIRALRLMVKGTTIMGRAWNFFYARSEGLNTCLRASKRAILEYLSTKQSKHLSYEILEVLPVSGLFCVVQPVFFRSNFRRARCLWVHLEEQQPHEQSALLQLGRHYDPGRSGDRTGR